MKKTIVFAGLILVACSSDRDERFCDCLTTSEKLNSEAAKYGAVDLNNITDEDVASLKSLMHKKDSICEPYEILGGEELKKLREACK